MSTQHDNAPPAGSSVGSSVTVETFPAWRGPARSVPLREGMTLDDLLDVLHVPGDTEAVLVNGAYVKPDYLLRSGDRVMVIPFMSGG
jgi:sulfur carrier protein ThiS